MAMVSLISLPKELLRQICGNLPCSSALEFLLVCRHVYQACNDWTVWRDIARRHVATYIPDAGKTDTWKRYVVAATKAEKAHGIWNKQDLQEYLPQLATLAHPDALKGPLSYLLNFYIFLSSSATDVKLAHAAAFSITVRHLSLSSSDWDLDKPSQMAGDSMFDTHLDGDAESRTTPSMRHLFALQDALANRAVGVMCARVRSRRAAFASAPIAQFQCSHGEPVKIATFLLEPPSATSIPLSRLMNLPPPFTRNSLEIFSTCHLSAMTDPNFFISGEWIGYVGFSFIRNELNSVGARHRFDLFEQPESLAALHGNLPDGQSSENFIRFRLVEGKDDGNQYTLQSNNFHSTENIHSIRMTVERTTGRLVIHHWEQASDYSEHTGGVITPFGIVCFDDEARRWLWFWKAEWSISRPCSCVTGSSTKP